MQTFRQYLALLESPLADFDTFGDPDTEGTFRKDDLRAMKSPAWRKKVENAFAKSPYKFNIYAYNGPDGMAPVNARTSDRNLEVKSLKNLNQYAGITPLSIVEGMIGKLPPDAKDSISVVLVENEGGERMPLTPWILVHRCVHAILVSKSENGLNEALKNLERNFNEFINIVEQYLGRSPIHKEKVDAAQHGYERIAVVASLIGKMKSAKNGKLANDGEFYVETITQYIINGHVSFERPMLDDQGLAPEHPALTVIPKEYQNAALIAKDAADFLHQLKMKYLREPHDSYTAYDKDGQAMVTGPLNPERQQREVDRGYTVKVTMASPKAKASYAKKMAERQNLKKMWNEWNEAGLIDWNPSRHATPSSDLHTHITRYETSINKLIDIVLSKCVGKALVL